MPVLAMVLLVFAREGMNISPDKLVSPELLLMSGISIEWFSQYDIMDGLRARRLKFGSPLGRIIDEAGDTIVMSNYSVLLAYCFVFDNHWLEMVWFFMNLLFYGMELKNKLCGSLVMILGEISAVEIELLLSIILSLSGIYGTDFLQKPIGQTFALQDDSYLSSLAEYPASKLIGLVFLCL